MDLTKFKLSMLNTMGAYSMFYFHASAGLSNPFLFLFATQTLAMSTQCFGQVVEKDFDKLMARTKNRPMPRDVFTSREGCMLGTGLTVVSLATFASCMQPYTWVVGSTVWLSYLCIYIPLKQHSSLNTLVGAVVGALPPFLGTVAQTGSIACPATFMLSTYIFSW